MREAVGGTWFFQLVIVFVLLFVAYLALSINYSKAFRVKNEVMSIIEREEGLTSHVITGGSYVDQGAVQLINNFLFNAGYNAKGKCEDGWIGVGGGDVTALSVDLQPDPVENGKKYFYCINKVTTMYKTNSTSSPTWHSKIAHYEVRLFFEFNLPMFGDMFVFKIDGITNEIMNPCDNGLWRSWRGTN